MPAKSIVDVLTEPLNVHRQQLATVRRATPAAMWGYAINITIACWAFYDVIPLTALVPWAVLSFTLCAVIGWRAIRGAPSSGAALQGHRVTILPLTFAVLLALPWSYLAVRYAGAIGGQGEIVLIAFAIGMAASGSILLAPLPQAAITYQSVILLPLVAKCLLVLPTKEYHVLGLLAASYWLFLVALITTTARIFAERTEASANLQASLVALNEAHREAELAATTDPLTGLANRRAFVSRLEAPWRQRTDARPYALLYLDLDGFKAINDALGHAVGDELLKEAARRLSRTTRDGDSLARIGGDEFALILENVDNRASVSILTQRLDDQLRAPFCVNGASLSISGSIGVAMSSECGTGGCELLKQADLAMYAAKTNGDGVCYFDPSMERRATERHEMEAKLRAALFHHAFALYYQPIRDLNSGVVTAFEALIRWPQPNGPVLAPSDFLPLAESLGLSDEIGEWVINEACNQAASWSDEIVVTVNVSPRQVSSGNLIQQVGDALNRAGLAPQRLQLEITEASLLQNVPEVQLTLEGLRNRGVSIALDDFGSGYSSLSYLVSFPFDRIKLDRQFIAANQPSESWAIVRSVVGLAKTLKCTVVAEGIECEAQLERLRAISVSHGQGFLLGRPLPSEETLELLNGRDAYRLSLRAARSA